MNLIEKKSYDILLKQGYLVEKPVKTQWQRQDFFSAWDFIAINNHHIRFIQVSKKYFTERPKSEQDAMLNFPCPPNCTKEYWKWNKGEYEPRIYLLNEGFKLHILEVRAIRGKCQKKKK